MSLSYSDDLHTSSSHLLQRSAVLMGTGPHTDITLFLNQHSGTKCWQMQFIFWIITEGGVAVANRSISFLWWQSNVLYLSHTLSSLCDAEGCLLHGSPSNNSQLSQNFSEHSILCLLNAWNIWSIKCISAIKSLVNGKMTTVHGSMRFIFLLFNTFHSPGTCQDH
jgi:hypothetical protein